MRKQKAPEDHQLGAKGTEENHDRLKKRQKIYAVKLTWKRKIKIEKRNLSKISIKIKCVKVQKEALNDRLASESRSKRSYSNQLPN